MSIKNITDLPVPGRFGSSLSLRRKCVAAFQALAIASNDEGVAADAQSLQDFFMECAHACTDYGAVDFTETVI